MNGPLGKFTSEGKMKGVGVLRSHGGRYQSIQDGEVHIDIAIIAAPTADPFGNATGDRGKSACGLIGFALGDSEYADRVIVVTDNLIPFPCVPWQIQGNNVDYVVQVDTLGDPAKIVSGTTEVTKSPDRLLIAEYVAQFLDEAGIMKKGFSFQAGAGGTALAFAIFLKDRMKKKNVKARFIRGGSTKYLVQMLEEGLTDYILDGQTFDLEGVRSMRENEGHVNTSPFTSYNFHGKGNFASIVDAAVLGATGLGLDTRHHQEGQQGSACVRFCFPAPDSIASEFAWPEVWLIIRRNLDDPSVIKFYFSNAPVDIPLIELVRLSGMRWTIETIFEEDKGEIGLDHYETRSWLGWHHHMLLVALAHHFLVRLRIRFHEKSPALTVYQVRLL